MRRIEWLVAGSITGGIVMAAVIVASFVNFETRYRLYVAERTHAEALALIQQTRDQWSLTLLELGAKRDTVDKWRRYFPRSMGGTK